jgi:outer membrane protein assembly factor BamB
MTEAAPARSAGRLRPFLIAILILAGTLPALAAGDWPQWRGPRRDGGVPEFAAPAGWPSALSLRWRVEVGEGHSSPVAAGDRVYILAREGEEEVLRALDPASGRTIWLQSDRMPYTMHSAATGHGKGPKSTPVVAGGSICALSISGVLSCRDAATGELRWRREFGDQFAKTSPYYGAAMSPLADGGRIIAHVGGHDGGALAAFDARTGEIAWRWDGDGPGYASPIIATFDGVRQVVTQTQKHLVGVRADTGALLWSVPFETPWVQNIVTPLIVDGTVVFSGLEQGIFALRPAAGRADWTTTTVWRNDDVALYMSSPVLAADRLCGLSQHKKGQFFCLDSKTGGVLWTGDGRAADQAALVAAGRHILALTDGGELLVFEAAGGAAPIARYNVADSPTWAHPAMIGGDILIKDRTSVARYAFSAPKGPPPTAPGG